MATKPSDQEGAEEWLDIYQRCLTEGQQSVERQFELFEKNQAAAGSLLQMNATLLGVLLSILALAVQAEGFDVDPFVNPFTLAGVALLVLSLGTYAVSVRPYRQVIGIGGETLQTFAAGNKEPLDEYTGPPASIENTPAEDHLAFYNWLTEEYGDRIAENYHVNRRKALALAIAALLFVYELAMLTLGVLYAFFGRSNLFIFPVVIALLIVVTLLSGIPTLLRRKDHIT